VSTVSWVAAVPYFSQWESAELVEDIVTGVLQAREDPLWPRSGARDVAEYEFWSWRTCGIACLRMVLGARGDDVPAAVPLAEECTAAGGYVRHEDRVDGLIYRPFVEWIADRFRLAAEVVPDLPPQDVIGHVDAGGLAMISVHPWVRWPDREPPVKGGHLVLAVGVDDGGRVLLHNPSGIYGESQQLFPVSPEECARFAPGRGVLFGGGTHE
jgi:Peptidase_C39 like family